MFNDAMWFYMSPALINTLLNLKFYLLTRCLMTHCGFISYVQVYVVEFEVYLLPDV